MKQLSKVVWQEAASPYCHPLAAANTFVRRVRWAGTFAYIRYLIMGRHISPSKVPLFMEDVDPI